ALPMWPSGPAWFLWQLFVLSALAAILRACAPQSLQALDRLAGRYDDRPFAFFVMLIALSAVVYVPAAMVFSAWDWTRFGPFSVQTCRVLHYAVYFFAGFALGNRGVDHGLLKSDGPLARNWLVLLAVAIVANLLWGGLTSLTLPDWNASSLAARLAAASAFPPACAAGALSLLAIALRLMRFRDRMLGSLSSNAYGIYLLHYVAVVWLQYA